MYMNIGYVVWQEDLSTSYIKSQVINVLKEIADVDRNKQVHIYSFVPFYRRIIRRKRINEVRKDLVECGIDLHLIPYIAFPRCKMFFAGWYLMPFVFLMGFPPLLFLAFRNKLSVLHCRSYPSMLIAYAIKYFKEDIAIVFDPRAPYPEEIILKKNKTTHSLTYKLWKVMEQIFLKRADMVVCIAGTYQDHYKQIHPKAKCVIVPNNVDVKNFRPDYKRRYELRRDMDIEEDEVVFVYSGSLGSNNWYNPQTYAAFLKGMKQLNRKFKLLFITYDSVSLLSVLQQSGISKNNYIITKADYESMPYFLSAGDIGLNLMDYKTMAMSIKTVEYLSMGLPILINSNVMGARELVEKHSLGRIIDVENIDINDVAQLIVNKEEISDKCRQYARKHFDTSVVAKKYIEVYDRFLDK